MLDIKTIKQDPEKFKEAMKKRNKDVNVDEIISLDDKRRTLLFETEKCKAEQNTVSKKIPVLKKEGQDTTAIFAEMKELSDKIKENDAAIKILDEQIKKFLLSVPNIPLDIVPYGKDSDDNLELRKFGTPPQFDFSPLPHWDIGKLLNILDPERAAKVTGSRFHFYKGAGARLERAVINFFLDTHTKNGYTEFFRRLWSTGNQ